MVSVQSVYARTLADWLALAYKFKFVGATNGSKQHAAGQTGESCRLNILSPTSHIHMV